MNLRSTQRLLFSVALKENGREKGVTAFERNGVVSLAWDLNRQALSRHELELLRAGLASGAVTFSYKLRNKEWNLEKALENALSHAPVRLEDPATAFGKAKDAPVPEVDEEKLAVALEKLRTSRRVDATLPPIVSARKGSSAAQQASQEGEWKFFAAFDVTREHEGFTAVVLKSNNEYQIRRGKSTVPMSANELKRILGEIENGKTLVRGRNNTDQQELQRIIKEILGARENSSAEKSFLARVWAWVTKKR